MGLKNIDNKAAEKGSVLVTIWQFVKFIVVSLLAMIVQFALLNSLKFVPPIHNMFNEAQASAAIVLSIKENAVTSEEGLEGKTIGVTSEFLNSGKELKNAKEVVTFETETDAANALKNGEVECAVVNHDTALQFMKENKDAFAKYQLPSEKDFSWLVFFSAAEIGGLAYFIISNIANIAAQIVSFFVNREKTFNSGANIAVTLPIYIVFTIALIAFSAWLNPTLKDIFMEKLSWGDDLSANAATMICSAIQFFLYFPVDKILFRKPKEEEPAKEEN